MKKLVLILMVVVVSLAISDRGLKIYENKYQNEKKVALVIGNSKYDNPKFASLQNPVNDARSMRNVLKSLGFEVLYLENATNKSMKKMVKKFKTKLKNGGVGFFYYAGHGIQVDNKNYLIAKDSDIEDKEDVEFASLALDYVVKSMQNSHDRLNIVVLDACRNDPFSRGGGGGLAPIDNAKGFFIAYATAPGETASDGRGGHGVFTKYIIKNITKPNKPIEQIFKEVRTDVSQETDEKQIPWTSSSITGDFYFKIDDSKLKHQEVISNTQKPDEILWNKIKNSKNIEDYKFFIKLYPNSAYISLAKFNIMKLQPKKTKKQVVKNSSNDKIWIDPDTNLMWQIDIPKKRYNWWDAKKYCSNLNLAGYSDWRLPSYKEIYTIKTKNSYYSKSITQRVYIKKPLLKSIYNLYGPKFWSSTFQVKNPYSLIFYMPLGTIDNALSTKDETSYVRCVRGDKLKNKIYSLTINTIPSSARVYITNIKPTYYHGMILKEAKYNIKIVEKGYETKRFTINLKKDTILNVKLNRIGKTWIDPDTNLMWQNEKYTQKEKKAYDGQYNYGKVRNWYKAKEYCNNLNLAGYSDWRLPTHEELKTIMTKTKYQSSNGYKYYIKKPLLKNMPPLNGKRKWVPFWSSTSSDKHIDYAWIFYFKPGYDSPRKKNYHGYLRCVRENK